MTFLPVCPKVIDCQNNLYTGQSVSLTVQGLQSWCCRRCPSLPAKPFHQIVKIENSYMNTKYISNQFSLCALLFKRWNTYKPKVVLSKVNRSKYQGHLDRGKPLWWDIDIRDQNYKNILTGKIQILSTPWQRQDPLVGCWCLWFCRVLAPSRSPVHWRICIKGRVVMKKM